MLFHAAMHNNFIGRVAKPQDLKAAYQFFGKIFGFNNIISYKQLQSLCAKNPDTLHIVQDRNSGQIVGGFAFVFIDEKTKSNLDSGKLATTELSSRFTQARHVMKPDAVYLSAIATTKDGPMHGMTARKATRAYFDGVVSQLNKRYPNLEWRLKPVTDDGIRFFVDRKGAKPIKCDRPGKGQLHSWTP